MNDFTSTERTLTENPPISFLEILQRSATPATVEDYRVRIPDRLQIGGFLTRSTIEDLPPNPLYMELFE